MQWKQVKIGSRGGGCCTTTNSRQEVQEQGKGNKFKTLANATKWISVEEIEEPIGSNAIKKTTEGEGEENPNLSMDSQKKERETLERKIDE